MLNPTSLSPWKTSATVLCAPSSSDQLGAQTFQDALGDRRRVAEPHRRADPQDVGVEHFLANLGPLISAAYV